jgi:Gas vesicle protein K
MASICVRYGSLVVTRRARTSRRKTKTPSKRTRPRSRQNPTKTIEVRELESLRRELDRMGRTSPPPRWNANPDDVQRSVVKLVLTLVEFIRQLLERQAIRRTEEETLTAEQIEAIGLALMRLEDTIRELGARFDLTPEDLNLDLGSVGKLM